VAKRPPGQTREELLTLLREKGETTVAEAQVWLDKRHGPVPPSTVRSAFQNPRYFERISLGRYRLRKPD
jgi:hypothetical protein